MFSCGKAREWPMTTHMVMSGNADCRGADIRQHTCILVVALLVAAVVAPAQLARQGHRIGVLLYDGAPPGMHDAFGKGLQELGYVEGKNFILEVRNARGAMHSLPRWQTNSSGSRWTSSWR